MDNASGQAFKREKRTLMTILFFFELSYLVRFAIGWVFADVNQSNFTFEDYIIVDLAFMTDGFALLALLIFHYKNFK